MTGADREWAARYKAGDVLKYETGSKAHGISRNSTATVLSSDASNNTITIQREGGQAVTYDPKRLKGVNVYRETEKEFSTGDRIQFTAKDRTLGVNNRDLGTITKLETGQITVQMDGKVERIVQFDPAKMRHFDHGYAVTSHVSQGLTEGRVIANIDTDSARSLINTRLAYVSVSRAEYDVRIYTNDAEELGARLATDVSKTSAIDFRRSPQSESPAKSSARVYEYADPNHRLAAVALAYAETPSNTVVIAKDQAERRDLNHLIRADLQASGTVAPDSKSLTVRIEQEDMNRNRAAAYIPGDIIQYKQGSPSLEGIPNNSAATVVSTNSASNQLTVKTSNGDEVTYSPHLTQTMTAQSSVYRPEQQEFAQGDRIRVTEPNPVQNLRKGDFGTIVGISHAEGFEVRFDKGPTVQLTKEQAQNVQYGYAVDSLKTGAPERILITQSESTEALPDIAFLSRTGREVRLYTSDGSAQLAAPSITLPNQLKTSNALPGQPQPSLSLPEQQQSDSPSNAISPQPEPAHHRHSHSHGR